MNYYDTYDFDYNGSDDYGYTTQGIAGEGTQGNSFDMATGSKKIILGTSTWLYVYQFYDRFGRVIQSRSNNHLSAAIDNLTTIVYDFEGKVLQTKTYHNAGGTNQTTVVKKMSYDFAGRLTKIYQNINGEANDQLVAQYKYNELGQVVEKNLHLLYDAQDGQTGAITADNIVATQYNNENTLVARSSIRLLPGYDKKASTTPYKAKITTVNETQAEANGRYLQSVDYRYNIRGWLNSINNAQLTADGVSNDDTNDYFGMELLYNTADAGIGNSAYYNGNIAATKWKSLGVAGAVDQRSYKYAYDKSDKLQAATFQANTGSGWTKEANTLNENLGYDANGNILTLVRNQNQRGLSGVTVTSTPQAIDNLTYTYATGNQMSKVEDGVATTIGAGDFKNGSTATTEYTYDTNGNVLTDLNKGISGVVYNVLGKAQQVTFTDGRTIVYAYDASGTKLSMATTVSGTTTTTNYVGGFVYTGTALNFFSSPEGRVWKNANGFEYQYSIGDHQGNTRVVFTSATPTAQSVTATFETAAQATEATNFNDYPGTSGINVVASNAHSGSNSQYLNGGYAGMVGITKSYKVYPGDKVSIQAYAKYNTPSGTSSALVNFAGALLSAFALPTPVAGETGTPSAAINNWGGIAAGGYGDGSSDNVDPKAFVNIIVFDKNYKFLDMTYAQVGASGSLLSASYNIKEAGYAYVYISNENSTLTDVYFDDVTMTYTPGNVIQYNEYYPFGLQTAESWTRDNTTNNFLYNEGNELNPTSGWYETFFRGYDPALGRFHQVDPLADMYGSHSVYHYAYNNPVGNNDPSGADVDEGDWETYGYSSSYGGMLNKFNPYINYHQDENHPFAGWYGGPTRNGDMFGDVPFGGGFFDVTIKYNGSGGLTTSNLVADLYKNTPEGTSVTYYNDVENSYFTRQSDEGKNYGGMYSMVGGKVTYMSISEVAQASNLAWYATSDITVVDFTNQSGDRPEDSTGSSMIDGVSFGFGAFLDITDWAIQGSVSKYAKMTTEIAKDIVQGAAKYSTKLAITGLAVSGVVAGNDYVTKGAVSTSSQLDLFFGGLAFVPGADIATVIYAGANMGSTIFTGQDLGQHIDNNFYIVPIGVATPSIILIPK